MDGLLLGAILGLGVLLVFDAMTRPAAKVNLGRIVARVGPKGAGAIAGGIAGFVLTGWPVVAVGAAVLGGLTPTLISRSRSEKERLKMLEALSGVSARLRDSIRSGIGLQDSLVQAASRAPSVIAQDLNRLVIDMRVSGPQAAGESFAERVGHPSAQLLGSALSLSERLGARNTSELLDALEEATRAQAGTLREAHARQTRNRMSARVVAAMPLLLLLAIRHSNPAYLEPFDAPMGQVVLAGALGMIAVGYAAMLRAARVERVQP